MMEAIDDFMHGGRAGAEVKSGGARMVEVGEGAGAGGGEIWADVKCPPQQLKLGKRQQPEAAMAYHYDGAVPVATASQTITGKKVRANDWAGLMSHAPSSGGYDDEEYCDRKPSKVFDNEEEMMNAAIAASLKEVGTSAENAISLSQSSEED
jgi:hypothetical protein